MLELIVGQFFIIFWLILTILMLKLKSIMVKWKITLANIFYTIAMIFLIKFITNEILILEIFLGLVVFGILCLINTIVVIIKYYKYLREEGF